jgi:hypothetical protein
MTPAHFLRRAHSAGRRSNPPGTAARRTAAWALLCPLLFACLAPLACTRQPTPPAATRPAASDPTASPTSAADLPIPNPGPNRGVIRVTGDHEFTSGATVHCTQIAGQDPNTTALRIELDPDDPPQPLLVLTVPGATTSGTYPAALSLRLDTSDGTFTESTGQAQVLLQNDTRSASTGADAGGFAISFSAAYAGAAGDGLAAGRLLDCALRWLAP